MSMNQDFMVPSDEIMKSIVLPTIIFCIGMVVAMLIGINKCKQWELDKVVEMRRTRRVVQRITERLREKNFNTIQKARDTRRARKLAAAAAKRQAQETTLIDNNNKTETTPPAPPLYSEGGVAQSCGTSPPPSYEDAILDEFYEECMPDQMRSTIRRSSTHSRTSHHSVHSQRARQRRKSTTGQRQKEFVV